MQAAKNSEVTNLGRDSMYGTGLHLGFRIRALTSGVRHNEMLYLLTLRQVSALDWWTPTRRANSYTTPLSPTMPVLTLHHRVRTHMARADLNHDLNHSLSRYAGIQMVPVVGDRNCDP